MQRQLNSKAESGYFKELSDSSAKILVPEAPQTLFARCVSLLEKVTETAENVIEWSLIGSKLTGNIVWVIATFGFATLYPLFRVQSAIAAAETAAKAVADDDFASL
eukprot:TRINITY_DN1801_c0_g2_i1.p1 TRINITY_DN1801_c0_g2~~TRINITY_DN1801_c0_g2_i1.p1  ORF type:complete len:121 (+),score=49.37 TRINITY_DN1801_c0_g2_i1:47-364(+)